MKLAGTQDIRSMKWDWIIGDKFGKQIRDADDIDPFHGVDFDGLNLARLSGISTNSFRNFQIHTNSRGAVR